VSTYRAYWRTAAQWGPPRETIEEAADDGCRCGPLGATLTVATEDPEAPGRTIDAETGEPIWPTHGMSSGAVRWRA